MRRFIGQYAKMFAKANNNNTSDLLLYKREKLDQSKDLLFEHKFLDDFSSGYLELINDYNNRANTGLIDVI